MPVFNATTWLNVPALFSWPNQERLLREMDRPKVLGDYRRSGFRALKITCCICWHEGEVSFDRIPVSRDRWPLDWLKFPHKGCGHTGGAHIRVEVVR